MSLNEYRPIGCRVVPCLRTLELRQFRALFTLRLIFGGGTHKDIWEEWLGCMGCASLAFERLEETGLITKLHSDVDALEKVVETCPNPKTRGAFTEVFNKEALERLTRVSNELALLQRATGTINPTIPGAEALDPVGMSRITRSIKYIVGTLGARIGAAFGGRTSGASLRTASKMAQMSESGLLDYMNRHPTKLLLDAATDAKLYRALITPIDTPPARSDLALQTILSWRARTEVALGPAFVGVTGVALSGEREETQRGRPQMPQTLEEALTQGGRRRGVQSLPTTARPPTRQPSRPQQQPARRPQAQPPPPPPNPLQELLRRVPGP